jgi:hypothetical protein
MMMLLPRLLAEGGERAEREEVLAVGSEEWK